jgi:hypothetical protein
MTKNSADIFETELYLRFKKNEKEREERFVHFEKDLVEREKERMMREMQRQREREELEKEVLEMTSDEESEEDDEESEEDDEESEEDDEDDDTIYCQICSKKYDDINNRTGPKGDRSCHHCCRDCFKQCMKIEKQGNSYVKKYTCFWCEGIHYFKPTLNEIVVERMKENKKLDNNCNIQNNKQFKKQNDFWNYLDMICFIAIIAMIPMMCVQ